MWYDFNRCNTICGSGTPMSKWNGTSFDCVDPTAETTWDVLITFDEDEEFYTGIDLDGNNTHLVAFPGFTI